MYDVATPPTPVDSDADHFTDEGKLLDLSIPELEHRLETEDWVVELLEDNHKVTWKNKAIANARMSLSNSGETISESVDSTPTITEENITGYECQCGKEFTSKNAAIEHLAVVGRLRSEDLSWEVGDVIEWAEETPVGTIHAGSEKFDVDATMRPNDFGWLRNERYTGRIAATIVDGEDEIKQYVDAAETACYHPPADYAFDDWEALPQEELVDGVAAELDELSGEVVDVVEDNGPTIISIDPTLSEAVFRSLTGGDEYTPEEYRFHVCSTGNIVVTDGEEYRLIAPRLRNL